MFKQNKVIYIYICIFFIFPHIYIGNFIIPTDELIFFQRGRFTTNQIIYDSYISSKNHSCYVYQRSDFVNGAPFGRVLRFFLGGGLKLKAPTKFWGVAKSDYCILLLIQMGKKTIRQPIL